MASPAAELPRILRASYLPPCLFNIWIPDGFKDMPADRLGPRERLKDSLDQIFKEELPGVIDSVESKEFGIGLEAYTVGSSEFYVSYAAGRKNVYMLLDNGHYHPTENVGDKISALLCFKDRLPLHVTRPLRWDSDHVVALNDDLRELAGELVRCKAIGKALIGLDFFDGSINRVAAWVIGSRNMQKALLGALLEPCETFKALQDENRMTELLAMKEEIKTYPFDAVWREYCARQNVIGNEGWLGTVMEYERRTLEKRG